MSNQMKLDNQCPKPKCGGKLEFVKLWTLRGKGQKKGTVFRLYKCRRCGTTVKMKEREV